MEIAIGWAYVFWSAVLIAALAMLASAYRHEFVIYAYERGVLFHKGKVRETLEPGRYVRWGRSFKLERIDVREAVLTVPNQEVLTKDGIPTRMSATVVYSADDPLRTVTASQNAQQAAYEVVHHALRAKTAELTAEEVLERRQAIEESAFEACSTEFAALGFALKRIHLRDLGFGGEMRNAMAQVAIAQKLGLAALERARGETAALRNLANAARMLEENPGLLQLRTLQAVSEAKNATIVIGDAAGKSAVRDSAT